MEKERSQDLRIETERVDDLSVLFAQLKKMGVAQLLDQHFPTHGNWGGLSLGAVVGGWSGPTHLNFEAGWLGECFHCSSEERPLDPQMVSHEKSRMERQES